MVCLSTPYHFRFAKGCLPQILLGPFLNTLPHMILVFKATDIVYGTILVSFQFLFNFTSFPKLNSYFHTVANVNLKKIQPKKLCTLAGIS